MFYSIDSRDSMCQNPPFYFNGKSFFVKQHKFSSHLSLTAPWSMVQDWAQVAVCMQLCMLTLSLWVSFGFLGFLPYSNIQYMPADGRASLKYLLLWMCALCPVINCGLMHPRWDTSSLQDIFILCAVFVSSMHVMWAEFKLKLLWYNQF